MKLLAPVDFALAQEPWARRVEHLSKAQRLMNNLGIRCAAGYLRNRGWSIETTLYVLLRTTPR
jgi:hypothetical protein